VLLVGDGGKLISASEVGQQALENGECVRLGIQGNVCLSDADADARSRLAVAMARWRAATGDDGQRRRS
jgi:hypothetical protein